MPEKSKKHVAALKKAAKDATTVWLAPDLDREGEAIAWHIAEILDLDLDQTNRVTFDEITEPAIRAAFEAPRRLNTALVDAQQARRAVDRIVGYRLSPVLWRTVASGISAGRVQSVALRMIVDREDEIRAFVPESYWSFDALFARPRGAAADIDAKLHASTVAGSPRRRTSRTRARRRGPSCTWCAPSPRRTRSPSAHAALDYTIAEVRRTEAKRNPKPPFKTSTLQGEASKSASRRARPWPWPSSCTRASTSVASRSGSSPTCVPTR